MSTTDYGGQYLKIRKAIYETGFDDFYQAGSISRFHKMNIVADSTALDTRFWICIDGGYRCADSFYIASRRISTGTADDIIRCASQQEIVEQLHVIRDKIRSVKTAIEPRRPEQAGESS